MVDMLTMPKALGLVGLNHREERENGRWSWWYLESTRLFDWGCSTGDTARRGIWLLDIGSWLHSAVAP